jgi:hypothetical protein
MKPSWRLEASGVIFRRCPGAQLCVHRKSSADVVTDPGFDGEFPICNPSISNLQAGTLHR